MKTYYYPISSTSLATIFSQACILPASLYRNKLQDVQNRFEDFILLTEHFGCSESDCCLEIVLTPDEDSSLVDVSGGFFLYESALPISRIKKIFFGKAAQAHRTISNITLATAFIPDYLVDKGDNTFANANLSIIDAPTDLVSLIDKVRKSYEKYNRILGAMALMRIAHEEGCNYSAHYIDLLSKFNIVVEGQKKRVSDIDTKSHKFFENHPSFLDNIVDFATLEKEAKDKKQSINKNKTTRVIDPSNLDNGVYLCYVLYDYGVGEESHRHKIDELILNNFTSLKDGYRESCALYYGYNRGYAVFNNQYKKEGKSEIVKYQLNSLLDYYTIESIFEYCFNNKILAEIKLFDSWVKPLAPQKVKRGEYMILDTVVRDKKKSTLFSEEWWKNCLSSFISKDKVVFLGCDFSSPIIETLLKPFAALIKDEISNEYEETIQNIKDSNADEVHRLKAELNLYKDRLATQETKSSPNNAEVVSSEQKNQETSSCNDIEYAEKVIQLCELNLKELKKMAGCKKDVKLDKKALVLKILAENAQDNKLRF